MMWTQYWNPQLFWVFLCFLSSIQRGITLRKFKPVMIGEPLNPADFEYARKLKIDQALAHDMTYIDGTENDIWEFKKLQPQLRMETETQNNNDTSIWPWPNGIVPYLLHSKFNESDRAMIAKAVQILEGETCVRLIPRTTEENYILVIKNTKSFQCRSDLGMKGGKQIIVLALRCIKRFGSSTHEFMHAIGFSHEQSRKDRDDHVIVHYENIKEGFEFAFDKSKVEIPNSLANYDLHSITHYGNMAFSKNGKHTIDPRGSQGHLKNVGQREKLTELDVTKVNLFYNCSNVNLNRRASDASEGGIMEMPTAEENSWNISTRQFQFKSGIKPVCKDFDVTSCKMWARYKFCKKSPMFMAVHCKRTCQKCELWEVDINEKCGEWAEKKFCHKYAPYMILYCAKSCRR